MATGKTAGGKSGGGTTVTGEAPGIHKDAVGSLVDEVFFLALDLAATRGTEATRVAERAASLPKNAIVRSFPVKVTAGPADMMPVTVVQARANPTRGATDKLVTVIVDFGVMVTVRAVMTRDPAAVQPYQVFPWNGQTFVTSPVLYRAQIKGALPPPPATGTLVPADVTHTSPSSRVIAVFNNETRTERLKIETVTTLTTQNTPGKLAVQIPDTPSNLELRVNGGTPAWTHPAAVKPDPGVTGAAQFDRWNTAHERLVELKDGIAPLCGDPTSTANVPLNLALTCQIPGLLQLTTVAPDVVFIHRLDVGAGGQREVTFDSEGVVRVPLTVPSAYTRLESISYTLSGKLPLDRVQPPVGPERSTVADFQLDSTLAACARIPAESRLVKLIGVRLPLIAAAGGAEVRVVLLENVVAEGPAIDPEEDSEPGAPMEGGASQPVTLAAGEEIVDPSPSLTGDALATAQAAAQAADDASWTTFTFDKPVEIEEEARPWVAVHVSRGRVTWSLGKYPSPIPVVPIRRGPPEGPWRKLPSMFQPADDGSGDPDLIRVGGRLRAVGLASPDLPLPPLTIEVGRPGLAGGARVETTPIVKGTPVQNVFAPLTQEGRSGDIDDYLMLGTSAGKIELIMTSHVAGTVALRDVDVIVRKD